MPLFWEKIGVFGKMSWIAMLFLLLGVEYRAIDKEHRVNEITQQSTLKTIRAGFQQVLTDQQKTILGGMPRSRICDIHSGGACALLLSVAP